jgi:predicted Zn-dependent protease
LLLDSSFAGENGVIAVQWFSMNPYNVNVAMPEYVGPADPAQEAVNPCEAIIRQAIDLAKQRRFSEAIEMAEKSVEQDPCSIPLHQLLVQLYLDTKRPSQAQQAILRLQELGFKSPEFSAMLGMVWLSKREFGESILAFREAKVLGALSGRWLFGLAEALFRTGRLTEADSLLEDLRGSEVEQKERSRLFTKLSAIRVQQKRYQEAIDFALEAMRTRPFKTTVFYLLGLALLRKGEQEGAAQAFEEYAQRQPERVAPYRYLERIAREVGDDIQADAYNLKARETLENRRLLRLERQRLALGQ